MHAQKKQKAITSDIHWCIENCNNLSPSSFIEAFKYEHLCHSFVIDPWDKTYEQKSVFTSDEIKEIKSTKAKKMPTIDDKTLKYLDEYKELKSWSQVRRLINQPQQWDGPGVGTWGVDDDNNSETWLLAHIWTIVDRAFDDIQLDVVRVWSREAGKQTDDIDSKLLREPDLKLPKALKNMMMFLKNERGSADGLRVVGLLQYG
ncbi:hypothetical protein INT45_002977 [Circinella minor]|uniref:Uncharacterized protein n=1 Tax=Circinella minor TaxID=1195481 RepID=A0A8H7VPX1_9FUNG|nr:hypothetical protein INT45_002977 [Circinella minor]